MAHDKIAGNVTAEESTPSALGVYLTAVHPDDKVSPCGEKQYRVAWRLRKINGSAKSRSRLRDGSQPILACHPNPADCPPVGFVLEIVPANPLGLPIRRVEKTHFPPGKFLRLGCLPSRIPNPDFPVISPPGFEIRPVINNSNRLRRLNFPAIPNVHVAALQTLDSAGY